VIVVVLIIATWLRCRRSDPQQTVPKGEKPERHHQEESKEKKAEHHHNHHHHHDKKITNQP
jgi:ABC-type nickel/cobalt efflux system permease component RcnA